MLAVAAPKKRMKARVRASRSRTADFDGLQFRQIEVNDLRGRRLDPSSVHSAKIRLQTKIVKDNRVSVTA